EPVHDPPAEERFPGERPAGVVLVEVNLVPVPGQQGEPHIVRLGDGPSDPAAHLGADPEVLEERPVVVHATLGERGSRNVMNVMGRGIVHRRVPAAPKARAGGEATSASGGARRIHPEHSTSEESDEKKQLSTAITSCSLTPSPYLVRR